MAAADNKGAGAPAGEETFVRRWSRRKQQARTPPAEVSAPGAAQASPVAPAAETPRVLTDADMPAVESLGEDSDYSGFLSAGVSEALRRQALRRLFTLPSFNARCPLDSEFYDCTHLEPLGNVLTHEMREALERETARLKEQARDALLKRGESPPASDREPAEAAAVPRAPTGDEAKT